MATVAPPGLAKPSPPKPSPATLLAYRSGELLFSNAYGPPPPPHGRPASPVPKTTTPATWQVDDEIDAAIEGQSRFDAEEAQEFAVASSAFARAAAARLRDGRRSHRRGLRDAS